MAVKTKKITGCRDIIIFLLCFCCRHPVLCRTAVPYIPYKRTFRRDCKFVLPVRGALFGLERVFKRFHGCKNQKDNRMPGYNHIFVVFCFCCRHPVLCRTAVPYIPYKRTFRRDCKFVLPVRGAIFGLEYVLKIGLVIPADNVTTSNLTRLCVSTVKSLSTKSEYQDAHLTPDRGLALRPFKCIKWSWPG